MKRLFVLGVALLAAGSTTPLSAQDYRAQALRIIRSAPLVDGHNDLPDAIRERGGLDSVDIGQPQPRLHTDLARMHAGGLTAQFWAAYVPVGTMDGQPGPKAYALEQIDLIHRLCRKYGSFAMALTVADIERNFKKGFTSCLIGIEGGHAIEDSLGALKTFYDLGVRYMTLTHNRTLSWADAAVGPARSDGLSSFGEAVVHEMNRLGMLVDISHVSDATMSDVIRVSRAPVIFSHSSARALTNHVRNVPDSILRLMRANGGIVMVNFNPGFVSEAVRQQEAARDSVRNAMLAAGIDSATVRDTVRALNSRLHGATLAQVANHIEHIARQAGLDHVGLGSDFDGISATPRFLEDVSKFPDLVMELLQRRWGKSDLMKLLGGNMLRVMRRAEAIAQR